MRKKVIYTCDDSHCGNNCPGHFDSTNEPCCKRPDGEYFYYKQISFWDWLKEKVCR